METEDYARPCGRLIFNLTSIYGHDEEINRHDAHIILSEICEYFFASLKKRHTNDEAT